MSTSRNSGYQHPFINARIYHNGAGEHPRSVSELGMVKLSAELRSRNGWWKKYKDPEVRKQWTKEALNKQIRAGKHALLTLEEHQINYVLDELSGYADLRDDETGIQVSCFDRIWECDIFPDDSNNFLSLKHIDFLRSKTITGTNSDIIVNPFRHCYIQGRTHIRSDSAISEELKQESLIASTRDSIASAYSPKFASLPAMVSVYPTESRVQYETYINGLDPQLSDTYTALQNLLGKCIKLFENVLTSLHRSNPLPHRIPHKYGRIIWPGPETPSESDDEDVWEEYRHDFEMCREIILPDIPDSGYKQDNLKFNHRVHFNDGQKIQVIHRIVDIHLDKERNHIYDSYWHVTGTKNERVVACALHFVSVENIDDASIEFRMAVEFPPIDFLGDEEGMFRTYGLSETGHCNQSIGKVTLRTGLTIAFPNVYQQRMYHVRLREGCDKGRLTLVEFYLVDPDIPPVLSTADVAPQQSSWIYRSLEASIDRRLPHELLERIISMTESVLTDEEADEYHQKMLKEMEKFTRYNNYCFFELDFIL